MERDGDACRKKLDRETEGGRERQNLREGGRQGEKERSRGRRGEGRDRKSER